MLPRLRFAYPTRLLEGPLREKVARAATLGVDGLQLDLRYELRPGELSETGRRQFGRLLGEHGLSLAPATFPLRRSLTDLEGLEERVAGTVAALRLAGELGTKVLLVRPGPIPAGAGEARRLLVEVLNDLARQGDRVGVTLALGTGRESPATLLALMNDVTGGPIGVSLDPGGLVMSGHDPAAAVRTLHAHLWNVRVRDGLRESDGAGVEVVVGRGEVDWEATLATLAEAEYIGWLTPDRTAGDDPAGDAARAVTYIRNVLPF